jgi:hypothetical protein
MHIHKDLIIQWANGATIEMLIPCNNTWVHITNPSWVPEAEYRVKPEPIVKYAKIEYKNNQTQLIHPGITEYPSDNVRLTFDPTTKELIDVELLK